MSDERGAALLRKPFAAHHISKLPKPTKAQTDEVKADFKKGIRCAECGSWHHPNVVHLDYVGHAALTDRLLDADPMWSWEPVAFRDGLPAFDQTGGLWIRLTVDGITRLGYGHAAGKPNADPGSREKEVIGDALRNAAMRFGAALDLWHKGDLHADEVGAYEGKVKTAHQAAEPTAEPEKRSAPLRGPIKTRAEVKRQIGVLVRDLQGCGDGDQLDIVLSDNKALIAQVADELEFWWNGDGADFIGLKGEIAAAREACGDNNDIRFQSAVEAG